MEVDHAWSRPSETKKVTEDSANVNHSVISVPCVPGLISAEVLKSFPGLGLSLRGLDLGTLPLTMVADRG